jgi:hypothetical protein
LLLSYAYIFFASPILSQWKVGNDSCAFDYGHRRFRGAIRSVETCESKGQTGKEMNLDNS